MRVSRTRKNGNRQHVEVGRVFALPCIVSFLLISFPFKAPLPPQPVRYRPFG